MPSSPNPAFIIIDHHSAHGPHKMKVCCRAFDNIGADPDDLSLTTWSAGTVLVDDMVSNLVLELVPRFPATSNFDTWSAYSQPDPDDFPIFVGSKTINSVGTAGTPGWSEATQESINYRDDEGFLGKLVLMDFASGNDFAKYLVASTIGVDGIMAELASVGNAWSSQHGRKPSTFISRTATLNEKLRRAYRLA